MFIGAAVYPTVAMLNHACDPGVVRYYVKDWLVVRAIRGISQGEEICENYGPIFFSTPRSSRRERLAAQYWFQCECRACAQDWPLMLDMDTQTFNLRCEVFRPNSGPIPAQFRLNFGAQLRSNSGAQFRANSGPILGPN